MCATRRARKEGTKEGRGLVGKMSSEASAWPEEPRVAGGRAGGREVRGRGVAWGEQRGLGRALARARSHARLTKRAARVRAAGSRGRRAAGTRSAG